MSQTPKIQIQALNAAQTEPARKSRLVRRGPRPMALEQRFMFDGAALADATQTLDASRTADTSPVTAERSTDTAVDSRAVAESGATVVRAVENAREILFVDSGVRNLEQLIADTREGIEIVVLNGDSDPWVQMSEVIARHNDLQAIHLLSHGEQGALILGGRVYDAAALQGESSVLQGWQSHLSADADVLLYGCDVAAGEEGTLLINSLAHLTQADVAASTDLTGAASQGGDWTLESSTGAIDVATLAFLDYQDTLAVSAINTVAGDNIVNNAEKTAVTISGTSTNSGTNVQITVTDGTNSVTGSATTSSGTWSTSLDLSTLSDGTLTIYTKQASSGTAGSANNDGVNSIKTITKDTVTPTPTVSATTINTGQSVTVRSSETGTAYLVNTSVTVTNLASITGAADASWNSVTIATANTDTSLSASGLTAGSYKVYVVDAAGNLSSASSNTVTVTAADSTPPDTSISSTPSLLTNATSATFSWSGTDNVGVTGYDYRLDSGSWTATTNTSVTLSSLADGSHTFEVRAKDAQGNVDASPASYTWTVDTTAPAAPSITAVTDNVGSVTGTVSNNGVTDDTVLVLSGTAEANSTVTVYNGVNVLGTATANGSGAWSYTTGTLSNATSYVFTAKATDAAGNMGNASSSYTVTIDATAPAAPSITAVTDNVGSVTGTVSNNGVTDDTVLVLSGTAEANSTVSVYNGITLLGTATANGSGAWSYTTGTLSNATSYVFTAKATDAAGNMGNASSSYTVTIDTTAPAAPSITAVTDNVGSVTGTVSNNGVTDDTVLVLSGTAEANSTVTIYSGVTSLGTTTADGSGAWSYTTGTLSNATSYVFTAKATDAAGNMGNASSSYTVTIDATAPAAPSITAVTDNVGSVTGTVSNNGVTDDTVLVLSGTAEANSTVTVYNGVNVLGTATANGSGAWSYTTGTLSDSTTYVFTAKATDAAGNTGSASSSYTVSVDTTAPAAPSITAVTDNVGSVTGTVSNNGVTDDTVLVLSGTAEANSTVTIYSGVTLLGTTTADGSGAWSYTTGTLVDGVSYAFTAKATDAAGNTGNASASYTVTVDTSAPATTVSTLAFSADTGTGGDFITRTASQTVSGTLSANLAAGESVQVSLDNGTTWQAATATVGSNTFSLAGVTLTGSGTLKVRVVDAAGNAGTVRSQAYVLDTTAPETTLATKPAAVVKTGSGTFSWSGSDAVGVAGYEYRVDGGSWTATAATSVTLSGLADGDHTFELRAIDTAGNADATPDSWSWTVDPLVREPSLSAANTEFGVLLQGTPFDPVNDTQSNAADTDLVGDAATPLLLGAYDSLNDVMYFRVRIGDPTMVKVGTTYVPRFTGVALIGLDVNNDGRLDLMIGVDGRNSGLGVVLYDPGSGANDRPSTTSITNQTAAWAANDLTLAYDTVNKASSTTTYRYELIKTSPTDLGASDGQDAYLTFKVPFSVIVQRLATTGGGRTSAITLDVDGQPINESSAFRFALFTMTQNNSINGDVGGITKSSADYNKPWSEISGTISFTKPTVLGVSGTLAYAENYGTTADQTGLPKALAPTATLSDLDTSNFRNSTLTLGFGNSSWHEGDALALPGGSNGITISGSQVLYNGAAIGSYAWDSSAHTLTVSFGPSSVPADAVQAVLRSVAFRNTSENPYAGSRTVTFNFVDPDNYASPAAFITVVVEAINDAPVISQSGNLNRTVQNSVSYDNSSPAATLLSPGVDSGLSISDRDAGTSTVEARLSVDKGVLDLYNNTTRVSGAITTTFSFSAGGNAYSVDVLGAGTSTLILRGSVDAVNAFLAGGSNAQVVYQPGSIPGEGSQSASLSLAVHDLGNSGAGGDLSATRTVGILTIEGTPLLLGTFRSEVREDDTSGANLSTGSTVAVASGSTLGLVPATAITYQGNSLGSAALGTLTVDANGRWTYTVDNSTAAIQALRAGQTIVETFRLQGTVTNAQNVSSAAIGYIEVTINGVNDAPVLQATGGSRSYTENAVTGTPLFSDASAAFGAGETGQTFTALTLTVSDIVDGDHLVIDGDTVAIDAASSGTLTRGGYTVEVSLAGGSATVVIRSTGASAAQLQALVESLRYASTSENPTALNSGTEHATRTVTLTALTDSGGTAYGGADTGAPMLQATVDITAVNDAPVATDAVLNLPRNGTRALTTADFGYRDAEGDPLVSVRITTLEAAGRLLYNSGTEGSPNWTDVTQDQVITAADIAAGRLRFQPVADASGPAYANFGFRVNDGQADSASANTITFNVIDNNEAPTTQDGQITLNEDEPRTIYAGDFFFGDVNGDTLDSLIITRLPDAGSLQYRNLSGQWVAAGVNQSFSAAELAAGRLRFVPGANDNGEAYTTLSFKVSDGDKISDEATLTLNVTPVNDAPQASGATLTAHQNEPYVLTDSNFGFSDPVDIPDNSFYRVQIVSLPVEGTLRYNGVAITAQQVAAGYYVSTADIMAGKLSFLSASNAVAATSYASITYRVQDDGGTANGGVDTAASTATITFDLLDAKAPKQTVPLEQVTREDVPLVFSSANGNAISIIYGGEDGIIRTTLSVGAGTLKLGATRGASLVITGDETATVTVEGLLDDVNAALDGLTFTPLAQSYSVRYAADGTELVSGLAVGGNATHTYAVLSITTEDVPVTEGDIVYAPDHDTVDIVVQSVNDAPALTATAGSSLSYTEGAAATTLFSAAAASAGPGNESGQLLTELKLTVDGLADGDQEQLMVHGTVFALTQGSSGDISAPGGKVVHYSTTLSGSTATVTLASSAGLTASEMNSLVNSLAYRVTGEAPTGGNRVITLTRLSDNGGTAVGWDSQQAQPADPSGGADTAVLSLAATVEVLPVNDAPSARNLEVPLNPDTPYVFSEDDFGFTDTLDSNDFLAVIVTSLPATGRLQYLDGNAQWQDVQLDEESGQWRVLASDIAAGKLRYLAPATDPAVNPGFDFLTQDNGGTDNGGEDTAAEAHTVTLNIVPLTVSSPVLNEASSYAVFEVTGYADQELTLALVEGDTAVAGNADIAQDQTLQIWSGSGWVDYSGSVTLPAGGKVLVRVNINAEHDDTYEGAETFKLRATNLGGVSVDGTATIKDDGTGDIHEGTVTGGSPTREAGTDNDLAVSVTAHGPVNEGSTWVMFTVTATPGQALTLTLGNTATDTDRDASTGGFTLQYSTNGTSWTTYSWNGSSGNRPTVPEGGQFYVRVNVTTESDNSYEGAETFTLTAATSTGAGRSGSATATIVDDGSGAKYGPDVGEDGPQQNTSSLDDDRTLRVNNFVVNEGSGYAVFRVSTSAGSQLALALSGGSGAGQATEGADYGSTLQYFNGTSWVNYNPAIPVTVPAGSSLLLVRTAIVNDDLNEGAEAFTLTATLLNGPVPLSATGQATIRDDGTGVVFNNSGAEDPNAPRDDDRPLKVNSIEVNEGSPHAVFDVLGNANAAITLSLADGSATGSGTDYGDDGTHTTLGETNLEVSLDGGASWSIYNGPVTLGDSGRLLVRTVIINDADREGPETFTLHVTQGGLTVIGTATIKDDGTGKLFNADGSEDTVSDKDDDFDKDGIAPNVEEILASMAASVGSGNAQPGDLNGDGVPDADQNALATLAWTTVDRFNDALGGTLTDIRPIISISVVDAVTGQNVAPTQQLETVKVLAPTDALIGGSKPVGANLQTPWDPIQFAVSPKDPAAGLLDIDGDASNGIQVRVLIDISRSNLDEGYFNGYMKYVSAAVITASGGTLRDLDGQPITTAGWYDFMQRTPGGDGARYITAGGKIMAIELIITDNRFGDNDWTVGKVFDPGLPVHITPAAPARTELPPVLPPAAPARLPAEVVRTTQLAESGWARQARPFDTALHSLQVPVAQQTLYLTEPVAQRGFMNDAGDKLEQQAWRDVYTEQSAWRTLVVEGAQDKLMPFRGMADQHVALASQGDFSVPWDAFVHTRPDAIVLLVARLADGSELPEWLRLGRRTGVFSYQAPAGFHGELQIELTARDTQGREASTLFRLTIGEGKLKPAARAGLSEQLRSAAQRPALWHELQRGTDGKLPADRFAPAANKPLMQKVKAG